MNSSSPDAQPTTRKERELYRKRCDLIVVAEQIFAQKGFQGASMEAIATAAEYAAGTLYRYFENKEILYAAVLEAKMQDLLHVLADRIGAAAAPGGAALEALVRAQLAFADANRAFFRIYFREHMEVSRAGDEWQRISALYHELLAIYADVIAAGQREGAFMPGDPRLYAIAVQGMVEGLVRSWLTETRQQHNTDVELVVGAALRAVLIQPSAGRGVE